MKKDYGKLWTLFKSMFMLSACTFGGDFVIVSLMKNGCIIPSFCICLILAYFYYKYRRRGVAVFSRRVVEEECGKGDIVVLPV